MYKTGKSSSQSVVEIKLIPIYQELLCARYGCDERDGHFKSMARVLYQKLRGELCSPFYQLQFL